MLHAAAVRNSCLDASDESAGAAAFDQRGDRQATVPAGAKAPPATKVLEKTATASNQLPSQPKAAVATRHATPHREQSHASKVSCCKGQVLEKTANAPGQLPSQPKAAVAAR